MSQNENYSEEYERLNHLMDYVIKHPSMKEHVLNGIVTNFQSNQIEDFLSSRPILEIENSIRKETLNLRKRASNTQPRPKSSAQTSKKKKI